MRIRIVEGCVAPERASSVVEVGVQSDANACLAACQCPDLHIGGTRKPDFTYVHDIPALLVAQDSGGQTQRAWSSRSRSTAFTPRR